MNQETIPANNLPVFFQRYDVDILDDKKESVGNVLYTTVGAIPSNEKEKRVWQLNLTGYLKPNIDKYNIVYDFSEVDYKYKEQISFEKIISGTFNICGQVLDASKIIGFDYSYSNAESTLTIKLDTSKWNFRLKKEVLFSYDLNVDDAAFSYTILPNTPYDIYYIDNNFVISDGSSYYSSFILQNIDNPTNPTYTTYSLFCVNDNNTQTLFLDYGDSLSGKLVSGESISINSYNVLYTQETNISNVCTVPVSRKVGTINFELCANNLPSTITPTTLNENATTTVTIRGLNVYNYYTFTVQIPGGSNVKFSFILMNTTVENTTDYSYAMIGTFWNNNTNPKCTCQFLTESRINSSYIVNNNTQYRATTDPTDEDTPLMTFSGYSYSSDTGNGTLEIQIKDYKCINGPGVCS